MTATDTPIETTSETPDPKNPPPVEWLEAVADVLRRTHEMTPREVAEGLATTGVLVLPTVPGDKDPMLTARHIRGVDGNGEVIGPPCQQCNAAGLRPTKDHGATTDPVVIRRYWSAHPDAGVGMKNHPRLVRGDGDYATGDEARKARKAIGYGEVFGAPLPCEARTPGGPYRSRYIHWLPENVDPPGGGTSIYGVSWYGDSGYTVVKGRHPKGGEYPQFYGSITELPEKVALQLRSRGRTSDGEGHAPAATDEALTTFLDTYKGATDLTRLEARRRAMANAREGERHHTAATELALGFRDAIAGFYPARYLVEMVEQSLTEAGWEQARFDVEWEPLQLWALGQVEKFTPETALAEIDKRRDEAIAKSLAEAYPDLDGMTDDPPPTQAQLDAEAAAYEAFINGATYEVPGPEGTNPDNEPPRIRFREIPDPFVLNPLEWHARGFLVAPTHGEMAGPEKSLKSYIGSAVDVGLAAGKDVLGYWEVTRQHRVLVMVGEGGENGYLRRLQRICEAYGVEVGDIRPYLMFTTQTAPTTSGRFITGLDAALQDFQPDLVHLDPWYAYHSAEVDARSLYEQGAALERVGGLVREGGATLIINNHFNQTGSGGGLRRISMAGHAEWCDSWWLLDHRAAPDVANGRFSLKMDIGSRQWGGGSFDIDFRIGRHDLDTNEHEGQITWKVTPSGQDDGEQTSAVDQRVLAYRVELVKAIQRMKKRHPRTAQEWLEAVAGFSHQIKRTGFAQLVDDGRFIPEEEAYTDAAGRTRARTVYAFVPSFPGGAK